MKNYSLVLQRIYDKLETGGTLLIRATVPSDKKSSLEDAGLKRRVKIIGNARQRFRREKEIAGFMTAAGFAVTVHVSPTAGVEEKWFVGKKKYVIAVQVDEEHKMPYEPVISLLTDNCNFRRCEDVRAETLVEVLSACSAYH